MPSAGHHDALPPARKVKAIRFLLFCGILSSLLYAAMNVFIALQWEEYSSVSQTVSELSAIGAPTRQVWVVWGIIYSLLFILFGCGIVRSAGINHGLPMSGILAIVYGVSSLAWPLAPMHLRGAAFTFTDTMHLSLAMVTVALMLLMMITGARMFGKSFRLYSIFSLLIMLAFGTLTAMDAPRIKQNLPTPLAGLWERINIGVFLLWVIVLAVLLLRKEKQ